MMSKKAIIIGLFVALLASQIGISADAAILPSLYCSPAAQSVASGEYVSFSAYNQNAYNPNQLTWTAVGGTPSYGYGSSFGTRFYIGSINETRLVSVTDGYQTSTCTVYVYNPSPTPTPTPTPYQTLQCSPSYTTANSGDLMTMQTWGGNGTYSWSALEGTPTNGYGSSFSTRFYNYTGYAQNRIVTVTSGNQSAICTVLVNGSYVTPTPTPTPIPSARVELRTLGRNVTRGQTGENTTVRARGGDTLDLIIRIRSTNGSYLSNAFVTDVLPAGLAYIPRSTTLNGYEVADGITSSGIFIGTLSPNTETAVKFSVRVDGALVPSWGTVTVNNNAQVRADGLAVMAVQFPVTLGQHTTLATVSTVKTGPADSVWLALLVSLLVTGAYAAYTRTDVFGRRTALAEVSRLSRISGLNFSK